MSEYVTVRLIVTVRRWLRSALAGPEAERVN